ncbi:MAG: transcriptional repressor [Vulcanimicrobiaceae bacterium]|jgi:Fur family ferric uptake transcriptional regulator
MSKLKVSSNSAPASRDTRQKRAIRDAFAAEGRPLSANEALEAAQARSDGVGIATVYRSIRSLLADGWLAPVDLPGEPSRYEIAGKAHHHHFRCSQCGRVFDLEGCDQPKRTSVPRGYRIEGHDVTVRGTCAQCARAKAKPAARIKRHRA